jgi:hypothetical protein
MTVTDLNTDQNIDADVDQDGTRPVDVARGEGLTDPFAPEGTDEKIISGVRTGEDAISEADSLKATKAALAYDEKPDSPTPVDILTTFITAFLTGFFRRTPTRTCLRADKKMRENMDEDQIDSMIDDSFPASDPPSSY